MNKPVIEFLCPVIDCSNYQVTSLGRIFNVKTGKYLEGTVSKTGYKVFTLVNDQGKEIYQFGHRLVAAHFIDRDNECKIMVNHKNRNRLDNRVCNLEWVTRSRNAKHAYENGHKSNNKSVCKIDDGGKILQEFSSVNEAANSVGVIRSAIGIAIKKGSKSAGFNWRWKNIPNEIIQEPWTEIPDHPQYGITKMGKIWSEKTKRWLNPKSYCGDYMSVKLRVNKKQFCRYVHRLVASTFIPKMNADCREVNHKDGNIFNNNVDNLEWVTPHQNKLHAHKAGLIKYKVKSVEQRDEEGNLINTYDSITQAAKITGISRCVIGACANKKTSYHTAGGYYWNISSVSE